MNGPTPSEPQTTLTQPTPEANPPVDRAAIEAEILGNLFEGKYQSVDDAKRGFWELTNYASQAHQLLQSQANLAPQAPPQANPLDQLATQALLPKELFVTAVKQLIKEGVGEELAPIVGMAQARDTLGREAPDYLSNEAAIDSWLRTKPTLHREVEAMKASGLHAQAAKYALMHWRVDNPPGNPGNPQIKAQAALPNSGVAPSPVLEPNLAQDVRMQAIQYARQTGDKRPAYSQVFPNFRVEIPPHLQAQLSQR